MTLAELLDNEDTPNAVEESSKSIPKYIPDGDVDKLASAIEEFAGKLENTLDQLDNLTKWAKLFGKKKIEVPELPTEMLSEFPTEKEVTEALSSVQKETRTAKKVIELEKSRKRLQAIREGKTLASHPWVVPAVLGAMGGAYLWDAATKSPQYERVS